MFFQDDSHYCVPKKQNNLQLSINLKEVTDSRWLKLFDKSRDNILENTCSIEMIFYFGLKFR